MHLPVGEKSKCVVHTRRFGGVGGQKSGGRRKDCVPRIRVLFATELHVSEYDGYVLKYNMIHRWYRYTALFEAR